MAKGLLFNQIGYESKRPARLIFRADQPNAIAEGTTVSVIDGNGQVMAQPPWMPWGSLWDQSWWVAKCPELPPIKKR
jgi:hypothetical protein